MNFDIYKCSIGCVVELSILFVLHFAMQVIILQIRRQNYVSTRVHNIIALPQITRISSCDLFEMHCAGKVSTKHAACVERYYSNYKRRNESLCCGKDWKW